MDEFYANGYQDFWEGFDDCPHPRGTAARDSWLAGWCDAESEADGYI